MATMYIFFITISALFLLSACEDIKETKTEKPDKSSENKDPKTEKKLEMAKNDEATPDVNTRFFDVSGLFNPNFNQRLGGNSGANLPPLQQFYPSGNVQGNYQQQPGPNDFQNGEFQQYPNQGNFGPNQNQGFNPQFSNGPNQWHGSQNPNQGGYEGLNYSGQQNNYPINRPGSELGRNNPNWYPNQQMGNFRPNLNNKIPNQYPNQLQGGGLPPVSTGLHTQVQSNPWDQQQYINQPQPIHDTYLGQQSQFPNQNNQRPIINPGFNNNYPGGNGQNNQYQNFPLNQGQNINQQGNQYPNTGQNFQNPQGGIMNQGQQGQFFNQQRPDQYQNGGNFNSGGTLDDIPPQYNLSQGAILGKPVQVPTNTISPDQIYFQDSSESPSQTQCVQDCPATPEYSPVCGTNNVTYFNPGKFVCARNCGVRVFVLKEGVCTRRPI